MNKIYSVDLTGIGKSVNGFALFVGREGNKGKTYYGFEPARCARFIQFMLAFAARVEKRMSEQEAK